MSTSRRASSRIAVKATAFSGSDDDRASEAYVPAAADSPVVRRRVDKMTDATLDTLTKAGSLAAGRMARNRESARRSRAGFSARFATLEASFEESKTLLMQVRSKCVELIGVEATAAEERHASVGVLATFIDDVPPTRASGSRTAISDEELERQARLGDIKAERMLSNRNSARESRRRKWKTWNEVRRLHETTKAACKALQAILAGAHLQAPRSSTPPTPERTSGSSSDSVISAASSVASVATAGPISSRRSSRASHDDDEDEDDITSSSHRAALARSFGAISAVASSRYQPASSSSMQASSRRAAIRTGGSFTHAAYPASSSAFVFAQNTELGIPVDSAEVDGAATPPLAEAA